MLRVLVLVGFACGAAQRPMQTASDSFTVGNGVIVAGNTVYIMSKDALTAHELATGKQRWASRDLMKPLVVRGNALVALDSKGVVRVVEARTGAPRATCSTIAGVTATRGWLEGKRVYVTSTEGVAELDVERCKHANVEHTEPMTTPAGTKFFLDEAKLHRERAKERLTTLELPINSTITLSADRRHVIVGNATHIELYEIDSGVVAETTAMVDYPSGGLLRGRLLIFCDVAVRAFDIDKKREVWSRPMREPL